MGKQGLGVILIAASVTAALAFVYSVGGLRDVLAVSGFAIVIGSFAYGVFLVGGRE